MRAGPSSRHRGSPAASAVSSTSCAPSAPAGTTTTVAHVEVYSGLAFLLGRAGLLGATAARQAVLSDAARRQPPGLRPPLAAPGPRPGLRGADVVTSPSGFLRQELRPISRRHPARAESSRDRAISLPSPGRPGAAARLAAELSRDLRSLARAARRRRASRRLSRRLAPDGRSRPRRRIAGETRAEAERLGVRDRVEFVGPVAKAAVPPSFPKATLPEHHPGGQRSGQRRRGDGLRALRRHHLRGRHPLSDRARPQRSPRAAWRCGRHGGSGSPGPDHRRPRAPPFGGWTSHRGAERLVEGPAAVGIDSRAPCRGRGRRASA